MSSPYQPPFTLTPCLVTAVAEISGLIERWAARGGDALSPRLRRENRIRTIHASLAIENNTLSLGQVTAVLEGRRVRGLPREIREVRNAFAAYEQMEAWSPGSPKDLLAAHGVMMRGLADDAGRYRRGGAGIDRREMLVHMAPPTDRVEFQVADLLGWLGATDLHPLLAGAVFHYELEFIHPFSDGNGRMGRLWQTLILSRWQPPLAWLPVESVIRDRQEAYYEALARSDREANATAIAEYILQALLEAAREMIASDQVSDYVSDQVRRLLHALGDGQEVSTGAIMAGLGLGHKPTFRKNYLRPAMELGLVVMTQPSSPRSPSQRYRLTPEGRVAAAQARDKS